MPIEIKELVVRTVLESGSSSNNESNSITARSNFGKLSLNLKGVNSMINKNERRKFLMTEAPFSTNLSIV